jgi:integrase
VRREGSPPVSKSFASRAEASVWARALEAQIDSGGLSPSIRDLRTTTVVDLLSRYEREITPSKRGEKFERTRIRFMQKHAIGDVSLAVLSGGTVARYRDQRLKDVQPATVRRELVVLRHVFEVAIREWNIPLKENPVKAIKMPKDSLARERRLAPDEEQKLFEAMGSRTAWYLWPVIVLAIETAMRRGELLALRWADVDLERRTAKLRATKNGHDRTIPLTPRALELLGDLTRADERVFPVNASALELTWKRHRKKAGLHGLRLHDLRHEAISRFFEYGLTIPEVALISGHRDMRMLSRYTHLRPEAVAEKLAKAVLPD